MVLVTCIHDVLVNCWGNIFAFLLNFCSTADAVAAVVTGVVVVVVLLIVGVDECLYQPAETQHSEELTELLNSQQKLEFHISQTHSWLAHLGRWKAHVLHTNVTRSVFIICGSMLIVQAHLV